MKDFTVTVANVIEPGMTIECKIEVGFYFTI